MESEKDTQTPESASPPIAPSARTSWRRLGERILSITPSEVARLMLVVLALGVIGWLIWYTWVALLPFQIGIVLAYLMLPLVNQLERWMPRVAAVGIVFFSGLLLLVGIFGYLVPPLVEQITQLIAALPSGDEIQQSTIELLDEMQAYVAALPSGMREFVEDGISRALVTIRDNIAEYAQTVAGFLISTVMSVAGTFAFLLGFLVIPFWLFYVLIDHRVGLSSLNKLLPSWCRADFWALLTIPDRVFSSYLRGQIFLGFVIGAASFLGLSALELAGVEGIRYKLLLAVFAGVMELIPYIGPIIGAVPAIGVGMLHSWETAVAITVLYFIIQQLEGNLLIPKVLGDSVNIHPAILTALLVALTQLGFVWFLLAAPLSATIRDLYRYIYGRMTYPPRPPGVLPGDPLPEESEPAQPGEAGEAGALQPEMSKS
jgi:predicted PurR-regulated permease PerM